MVDIEDHNGIGIAYVSPMVCEYNEANLDHGPAATGPGWYVDGEGPFDTRDDACAFAGVDASDDDWDYIDH